MQKDKRLVPKLRFLEFEREWEEKKMNTLFSISAGGDVNKENVSKRKTEKFRYPIYANATGNKGLYGYSDIYKVDGETLTITGRGVNIGVAHSRKEKYFPIVRLLVLRPKKDENVRFFEYQFNKQNIFVESTGVPQLTAPQVSTYKVFRPEFEEQQKIANFIIALDTRLQSLRKKKSLLDEYKKGLMQQIFKQEIRFKDDYGDKFPVWKKKKLGEVANVYQPKTISQSDLIDYGYLVYGANGVIGYYSEFNHETEQIAITCRGNTCGTVNFTKAQSWITGNAMVINVDDFKHVNKRFLFYQLSNTNFRYLISGSGQPQITGNIKTHFVKLPSLSEQVKIADFLSAIDKKITLVEEQIEKTKTYKKGLLQQMFI